jgi:uncharacterized protein (DUF433 family)
MTGDDRYLDAVTPDDVRIKGTRVGIEHVLSAYLDGYLPEEIAVEFPTVTLEQVHGVIAWYLRSQKEADDYLRRWQGQARSARAAQAGSAVPVVVQRLRQFAEEQVAR